MNFRNVDDTNLVAANPFDRSDSTAMQYWLSKGQATALVRIHGDPTRSS
jgi:hypothetical protein